MYCFLSCLVVVAVTAITTLYILIHYIFINFDTIDVVTITPFGSHTVVRAKKSDGRISGS